MCNLHADVEISFEISDLKKAEVFDPSWTNPQMLCIQKGASVKSALGPFGLLALASKDLKEYTAVFFRIFKGQGKYVVLMCSDQSRLFSSLSYFLSLSQAIKRLIFLRSDQIDGLWIVTSFHDRPNPRRAPSINF